MIKYGKISFKKKFFFKPCWYKSNILKRNRGINFKSKNCIIFIFLLLICITQIFFIRNLFRTFNKIVENRAEQIAINIINDSTSNNMEGVKYEDLTNIERDEKGNIKLIQVNTEIMNKITGKIDDELQKHMNELKEDYVYLPLSSMFGSDILTAVGPTIRVKILPKAKFSDTFKSEFVANGINQTIHRIYIVITCDITIITPINKISSTIDSNVLIEEVVIIGDVPSTYYNVETTEDLNSYDGIKFK